MNEVISIEWLHDPVTQPDELARQAAEARQTTLTKPPQALGRLEQIAIDLAAFQGTPHPEIQRVHITVFAADHGIAAEGVSAFPQVVTTEMVRNFVGGGAAINAAARTIDAELEVVNLGTVHDTGLLEGVINQSLGLGTANFLKQAAMTETQIENALSAGRQAAQRASTAQLFIGGEMGIANTTSATALACALLNLSAESLTGPGTGLDAAGVAHKTDVINKALNYHRHAMSTVQDVLRCLGGFEIAALAGAYISCAQQGIPILVDGFISSVAALVATRLCPDARHWMLFAHLSKEPGHTIVLETLNAKPFLDFNLCLGEGSGAAVVVPLLRMACTLHNDMHTFAEAQVSTQ